MIIRLAAAMIALVCGGVSVADDNPWPDRAAMDLQAIHDIITVDHPGPAIDAEFAGRLERNLSASLIDAETIENVTEYIYLLFAYVNQLPDHHLAIWGARDHPEWAAVPRPQTVYPGFITAFRPSPFRPSLGVDPVYPDGGLFVRGAADGGAIHDGLELMSCDGIAAYDLAMSNLFRYHGKPGQPADWARFAPLLFIDLVMRHPNARHVGWPTRAHGLYGELRQVPLPSGWAWLAFSTKAFMSRGAQADDAIVPEVVWDGEISDTPALEDWIHAMAITD